jgi:hypothetical protein
MPPAGEDYTAKAQMPCRRVLSELISFGYAMEDHFKEAGEYKIKWKGEGFEAPEVVFRVMPKKKADR